MNTLISADNTWILWGIIIGAAAISIVLEQKTKIGATISGAVVALIIGLALSNLKVIPTEAPVYDTISNYLVPAAIPMLLFQADIRKIWRQSGRMFKAFWFAALGTTLGTFVATLLMQTVIPELGEIAGMMTASYVGGGVNFVAMTSVFNPTESLTNATIVADNVVMAIFILIYMYIPNMKWFRKRFPLSYPDGVEKSTDIIEEEAEIYAKKSISLLDIALTAAIAIGIAAISFEIGSFMGGVIPTGNVFMSLINTIFSNHYFLMTLITIVLVAIFPNFFEKLGGGQEIGTFFIYLFFVIIGVPASISEIFTNAPLLFVFCIIIAAANLLVLLLGAKMGQLTLEEAVLAANATVGGPTTGAAMAITKGWNSLAIPTLLCGLSGYVFGNFIGLLVGNTLIMMIG